MGPITCQRLTLKGKFFVPQEKAQRKAKDSVVMNLNVSADDINKYNEQFHQICKMSNIWANRKVSFPKVKVLIFLIVFSS